MKKSTARKLRFSFIGKIIFNIRVTDKIARKFFLNKFTNDYYSKTTLNWKKINDELFPILKKYKCFLGHGAALFLIRDGMIKENQDLDYDMYELDDYNNFIDDMKSLGYKLVSIGKENDREVMFIFEKNKCYIDFFIMADHTKYGFSIKTISYEKIKNYFKEDGNFLSTNKSIIYLRKIRDPNITMKYIDGEKIFLPEKYNEYFEDIYGKDWMTPKKYYNWALNPKTNIPIKIKKNIKHYVSREYLKEII